MSRKQQIIELCETAQKHLIERMCDLTCENKLEDSVAIYEEIKEWLSEKEKTTILTLRRVSKT